MTDPEFFATYPDVEYRLRIAYVGEAPEGSVIAVHQFGGIIQKRIASPDCAQTSNERMAKYAFEDSSAEVFDA